MKGCSLHCLQFAYKGSPGTLILRSTVRFLRRRTIVEEIFWGTMVIREIQLSGSDTLVNLSITAQAMVNMPYCLKVQRSNHYKQPKSSERKDGISSFYFWFFREFVISGACYILVTKTSTVCRGPLSGSPKKPDVYRWTMPFNCCRRVSVNFGSVFTMYYRRTDENKVLDVNMQPWKIRFWLFLKTFRDSDKTKIS